MISGQELVQPEVETSWSEYVITCYRHTEQNLRSRLHRIAEHAGVERWPKRFICLRVCRRTELERIGRFANHVLNDWFGHSGAILSWVFGIGFSALISFSIPRALESLFDVLISLVCHCATSRRHYRHTEGGRMQSQGKQS